MHRRSVIRCAAAALAALTIGSALPAPAAEGYRLSGPYSHENLAIYLIHGPGRAGPVPLSLEEALLRLTESAWARSSFGNTLIDVIARHKRTEIELMSDLSDKEICERYALAY